MNDLAQRHVSTPMDAHALSPALGLPHLPDSFPQSPFAAAFRQPSMLGLFLPIQAGGRTASRLPRTTTWTFDYNAAPLLIEAGLRL